MRKCDIKSNYDVTFAEKKDIMIEYNSKVSITKVQKKNDNRPERVEK